jgi:hypothetical protein
VVDIDRCGGYGGCCGARGIMVCGAGGPIVGGLLGFI